MSRSIAMQCWKCGSHLQHVLLPFSRYEECTSCKTDLHVCLGCQHYDAGISDACREDRADFVLDKDKANFCDYFRVNPQAFKPQDRSEAETAQRKLAELFGEPAASTPEPDSDTTATPPQSDADKALAELKRLFGDTD